MGTSAHYCTFVVHPDGDDLNGGAFHHGYTSGTDASQDNDPIVTIDGSTITCTLISRNVLKVDGYDVATSDIGNCLFGQLDNSAASWIESGPVTSVDTSNNFWNFGGTQAWNNMGGTEFTNARLGGALATPGGLNDPSGSASRLGSHSIAYIKAATYTLTSSDEESGGRLEIAQEQAAICAYKTTPGDYYSYPDDRVIIDTGSTANDSNGVVYFSTSRIAFATGIEVNGNDTWSKGFSGKICVASCIAKDCTEKGFALDTYNSQAFSCRAENCGTSGTNAGFGHAHCFECIAIDCEPYGFYYCNAMRCISHGGTTGFGVGTYQSVFASVADGATGTGFSALSDRAGGGNCVALNCATGMTSSGCFGPGSAFYNNTQNTSSTMYDRYVNPLQLTAAPFTDSGNYDYTLNDDSGGGADLATRSPKFGASVSEGGPQQQQSAQLKSTGSSGGGTTVPQGLHSIEAGINA